MKSDTLFRVDVYVWPKGANPLVCPNDKQEKHNFAIDQPFMEALGMCDHIERNGFTSLAGEYIEPNRVVYTTVNYS
jgi:hypothetical protein